MVEISKILEALRDLLKECEIEPGFDGTDLSDHDEISGRLLTMTQKLIESAGEERVQEALRVHGMAFEGDEFVPRGVNIEVPAASFSLTSYAPTVETTGHQSPAAGPHLDGIAVDNAEDIDRVARQRFTDSPAVVLVEARRAADITYALRVFLKDQARNEVEYTQALELLDHQEIALKKICIALEEGGDRGEARQPYLKLVDDVLRHLFEVLKKDGPTRGILAAAALVLLGVVGADVGWLAPALVAASITGVDLKKLKKLLRHRHC